MSNIHISAITARLRCVGLYALVPPHVALALEGRARDNDCNVDEFIGILLERAFYEMVTYEVEGKGYQHRDLNPARIIDALNNRLPQKAMDGSDS
jgi:hypothetical protein